MVESYMGTVRGGEVVFEEDPPPLPDGTKVQIEPVELGTEESKTRTLAELFKTVAGKAQGLPSDLAAQHDHYLHGLPKR